MFGIGISVAWNGTVGDGYGMVGSYSYSWRDYTW